MNLLNTFRMLLAVPKLLIYFCFISTHFTYYMSKKSWPLLCSKILYKLGQEFLGMQYIQFWIYGRSKIWSLPGSGLRGGVGFHRILSLLLIPALNHGTYIIWWLLRTCCASIKKNGVFSEKEENPICDCSLSNQISLTEQMKEIAPYVRTYLLVTLL